MVIPQIIAIRYGNTYYYAQLLNNTISNEVNFNPFDFYFTSKPPTTEWIQYAVNNKFSIIGKDWKVTTVTAVSEMLSITEDYDIPVFHISNTEILVYYKYIPFALIRVNGQEKHALNDYSAYHSFYGSPTHDTSEGLVTL